MQKISINQIFRFPSIFSTFYIILKYYLRPSWINPKISIRSSSMITLVMP